MHPCAENEEEGKVVPSESRNERWMHRFKNRAGAPASHSSHRAHPYEEMNTPRFASPTKVVPVRKDAKPTCIGQESIGDICQGMCVEKITEKAENRQIEDRAWKNGIPNETEGRRAE